MHHRPIRAILADRAEAFRRIAELDTELITSYSADLHDAADHTQRAISSQILHFVELYERQIAPLTAQIAALSTAVESMRRDLNRAMDAIARIERGVNGGASNGGGVYE